MSNIVVVEQDAVVASMGRARAALAEARTIQETKRIVDAAAAAEIYARRQKLGEEASELALSIKVEALRKLGAMLRDSPKAEGTRGQKLIRVSGGAEVEPPERSDVPTLSELGLTKKDSAVAQKLAALSEAEFRQVRDGHVTVSKAIAAIDSVRRPGRGAATSVATETASPVTPAQRAPGPAPEVGDDARLSDTELLQEMQRDLDQARATAAEFEKALLASDDKARFAELIRRLDHAVRQQHKLMADAAELKRRADTRERQLARCGRAVGQRDLDKVAPAVEAIVRRVRTDAESAWTAPTLGAADDAEYI